MKLLRLFPFLLMPAIPLLQIELDRRLGTSQPREETLYLRSGEHLRSLVPGFDDLLADIYWLRTVQYFGSEKLYSSEKRFELLYPLIDVTTTLDPRLRIAYKYGAIFLCEERPVGKGDCEAGIRVLEKGVRVMPDDWRLKQDIGYYRYLFLHDAKGGAAVLFETARDSRVPGAGTLLSNLAEVVLARGADRSTEREMWRRVHEQEEEGFFKNNALDNLRRLDALDTVDSLNAAVERFRVKHGRFPSAAQEVRSEGIDPRHFSDPTGVPFSYDPVAGRFAVATTSKLWRGYHERRNQ